ncbi:leucine-rich repeat protein [Oribacterium parvum]|uniref:leucine-rich repeat protein n=1 Tax=Oribacterium parvum TaxID=1501329 RepID=UPI0028E61C23|nr:leucine-rich repeat protein [Oribacterium parvum]
MRKRAKTALAFLLALSCVCSTAVSAESLKRETVQPEAAKAESVEALSGETVEEVEAEKIASEDAETEKAISEESEMGKPTLIGKSAVEESEEAFLQEQEISGVLVSVKADPGVFPKGAKLQVKKVGKAAEQKVDNALKKKLLENQENLLQSMIFDISVLNQDGEEVQPDSAKGEVKVQFSHIPFLQEDAEKQISVFHLDSVDAAAEKLATEKIKEKENAVEVSAEHFSLFAVSLVKKENSFSDTVAVELGETISLYKLLRQDVLRCEAMKETDPAVVRLKHDGDGQVAIEALHEGTARLLITIKDDLGEEKKEYRIIVQKASLSGRAGKEIEYSLTGSGNEMTLTLRGRGETDAFELAPWEPYRDKIRRVIIGEGIEKLNVEMEAFGSMEHLETVSLPSTLTEIPDHAFYHSENLGDVTIPASVRRIGEKAFYKSKGNGKKNTIINHSSVFMSEKGSMQYNPAFTSVQQTAGEEEQEVKKWNISMKNVQFYTLPEINKCFFELETEGNEYANFYLYTTEDPSEAVTVKNFTDNSGSFKRDLRLFFFSSGNGWRLPGTNKTFTSYLFDLKDTGLFSFLPGHTYYCTFLMNPGGITKPYSETQLLQKVITVSDEARLPRSDGNFSWQLTGEKSPYTLTIEGSGRMQGLTANGELRSWNKLLHALGRQAHLELKGNITALDPHALEGITDIKKGLVLPDSIVEIGDSVFYEKSIQGNLVFPAHLKKIGNSAFRNLSYKGDLFLPEGLKSIGESAFRDLKETNAITIPASVTDIGTGAFYKDRMSFKGKNSIANHSSVKLGTRYVNPLFTDYTPDDSGEAPIPSFSGSSNGGRGGSSGGRGGSYGSGGSGGGSTSGGSGGSGGTLMVLGADRNLLSNVNWQRDAKGWWILNPDGTYPKAQWLLLNNRWYYFNQEGYMLTGWLFYNNAWYYFEEKEGGEQGKMSVGWKEILGFWYYFSEEVGAENGKMRTGWQEVKGKWYYLNPESGAENGKMLFNTKVEGYTLGTDGAWQKI